MVSSVGTGKVLWDVEFHSPFHIVQARHNAQIAFVYNHRWRVAVVQGSKTGVSQVSEYPFMKCGLFPGAGPMGSSPLLAVRAGPLCA